MTELATATAVHEAITVRRVLATTEAGGAVFAGTSSTGQAVRVVASHKVMQRIPVPGEVWEVRGNHQQHPKYGRQLTACHCVWRLPKGRLIIDYLVRHPDFAGIGQAKATRLYERFGDRLVDTLNAAETELLTEVLTAEAAERLIAAWTDKRAEAAVVAWLDAHGFDLRLANKLRRVWGERAVEMLDANPYHMLAFAAWRTVDAAAAKLAVRPGDPRRLVGAVEASLYERLDQGHTLTAASVLAAAVQTRLKLPLAKQAIAAAVIEGAIVGSEEGGYQPLGAAALERGIEQRIASMLAGEAAAQGSLLGTSRSDQWLAEQIRQAQVAQGFALNPEQRQAVCMAASKRLSLLTGGAGVGKTTVLRVILHVSKALDRPVLQMALAGRAAKQMTAATGHRAMTIAKFLADARTGKLQVSADALLVVDEASMLDLPTLYRILRFLPDGVRVLLVGDAAQLPPIGFGLVFHRLVACPRIPKTELTQVHRQAASSGIPAAALSVRCHDVPTFGGFERDGVGVAFLDCAAHGVIPKLFEITSQALSSDWQILAATKQGAAGIESINASFHEALHGRRLAGFRFAVGDPVIYLVNDHERDLMNGSLGRIVEVVNDETPGLQVDFDGARHFLPSVELAERLALAYAISVHKAQGSQFRRVAVVVQASRILDHALIYTALTRGVEQVVFIGDRDAFGHAVRQPPAATRRSVAFTV